MTKNNANSRHFRVRLSESLVIQTIGAFGDDRPEMDWSQDVELWQAMLFHNPAYFNINGEELVVKPWSFVVVPPGSRCHVRWQGEGLYIYNYFGFVVPETEGVLRLLPQQTNFGNMGEFWNLEFRKGLSALRANRLHAVAIARAMLWSISKVPEVRVKNLFVVEAERVMAESVVAHRRVDEIADRVGISQNQLSRLFAIEHGLTPKQFMLNQLAGHVRTLLSTTTMSIKSIASECGFQNLHHFNRFVRSRFGVSPRDIRAGRAPVDVFRVETYKVTLDGESE